MRFLVLVLALLSAIHTSAQTPEKDQAAAEWRSLPWERGPGSGTIASKATVKLGKDDAFLGEQGARKLLVLMGNPPRDGYYAVVPTTNENWVGVFMFDPAGYVRDDEKIDADALLATMKEGDAKGNAERTKLGMSQLHLLGWHVPPHYDSQTKRIEWGTRLQDESGEIFVNYTARLLGRTGVMSATLVSNPTSLDVDRKAFAKRLEGFQFVPGETYSEFRQGDRVAEYGLAALVLGGAAALATKKGFWAVLAGFFAAGWKFIGIAIVGAIAWMRSFFKKKA
jgi:uncharacterized membrane-anchored protein